MCMSVTFKVAKDEFATTPTGLSTAVVTPNSRLRISTLSSALTSFLPLPS